LLQFSLFSLAYHMHHPPHSPWIDLPNDIWGWVQNMKLLIMQLPPFSLLHLCLVQIFSSEPYFQTRLVYAVPLMWDTKFYTHTKQV
jgi:hypothetical protein